MGPPGCLTLLLPSPSPHASIPHISPLPFAPLPPTTTYLPLAALSPAGASLQLEQGAQSMGCFWAQAGYAATAPAALVPPLGPGLKLPLLLYGSQLGSQGWSHHDCCVARWGRMQHMLYATSSGQSRALAGARAARGRLSSCGEQKWVRGEESVGSSDSNCGSNSQPRLKLRHGASPSPHHTEWRKNLIWDSITYGELKIQKCTYDLWHLVNQVQVQASQFCTHINPCNCKCLNMIFSPAQQPCKPNRRTKIALFSSSVLNQAPGYPQPNNFKCQHAWWYWHKIAFFPQRENSPRIPTIYKSCVINWGCTQVSYLRTHF